MDIEREQEMKAIIVTSQGNPDLSAFEKAANEIAGALKLLRFQILLDKAGSDGLAL